ncbi:MAG: FAD-binding oxidoreductase [Candidatus Sericytochromatia bacterium]
MSRHRLFLLLACSVSLTGLNACSALQARDSWLWEDFYLRTPPESDLTLAPPLHLSVGSARLTPTTVVDATRLHPIAVAGVVQPRSSREIQTLVYQARLENRVVSMSGARHSMGGQVAARDSLHLDLTRYNAIRYEAADQSVTVQSGATWKQIQRTLGPVGRAVQIMQDSNIFTVGGSLAANVHGKDPRYPSLIASVNWFKLLTADGRERLCSRTENPELFRAVIGGMGLLGIVTEVNLKTEPNRSYRYTVVHHPLSELISTMERLAQLPDTELIEAQLAIDQEHMLEEAQIYYHSQVPTQAELHDDVNADGSIWLKKAVYRWSRSSDAGRQLRWTLQKEVGPSLEPAYVSRNTAMAATFRHIMLDSDADTDILQEYFVPTAQAEAFLRAYRQLVRDQGIDLLNVTVRKTLPDRESVVPYATTDMYAFVVYLKIRKDERGQQQMETFTRELMDILHAHQGTFYLIYRGYYTPEQVLRMYPQLRTLFALKAQIDPQGRFQNEWYRWLKPAVLPSL